jgi:hypothetical protein
MSITNTTLEAIPTTIKAAKKRQVTTLPGTSVHLMPDETTSTEASTPASVKVAPTPSANPPVEADKNQDQLQTSAIQKLEAEIRLTHSMASRASLDILLGAAKCGLLLQLGKAIAGHGNFEEWVCKRDFGFCKATRCNYMRFAEHLVGLTKSTSVVLMSVELNKEQQLVSYSFDEDALKAIVIEVSNGRSITDLYVDWNITKSSPTQSGKNSNAPSGADIFKRLLVSLDVLPNIFPNLQLDEKSYLIEKMESILKTLKSTSPNEKAKQ